MAVKDLNLVPDLEHELKEMNFNGQPDYLHLEQALQTFSLCDKKL